MASLSPTLAGLAGICDISIAHSVRRRRAAEMGFPLDRPISDYAQPTTPLISRNRGLPNPHIHGGFLTAHNRRKVRTSPTSDS